MKKSKLISLGSLLWGIAAFIAYPNGAMASENSKNSEVSNESRIVEGNLFKGLKFEKLVILKDFSVPITKKEGVKEILSKQAGEINDAFSRKLKDMPSISYYIVHEGDKLIFKNFNVVERKQDDKQEDPPVFEADCPDGLEHIKTCYSRTCVRETLEELEQYFSNGDTIYIHHSGWGGVIICSDVQMR